MFQPHNASVAHGGANEVQFPKGNGSCEGAHVADFTTAGQCFKRAQVGQVAKTAYVTFELLRSTSRNDPQRRSMEASSCVGPRALRHYSVPISSRPIEPAAATAVSEMFSSRSEGQCRSEDILVMKLQDRRLSLAMRRDTCLVQEQFTQCGAAAKAADRGDVSSSSSCTPCVPAKDSRGL
jgi:hypothetical protein